MKKQKQKLVNSKQLKNNKLKEADIAHL